MSRPRLRRHSGSASSWWGPCYGAPLPPGGNAALKPWLATCGAVLLGWEAFERGRSGARREAGAARSPVPRAQARVQRLRAALLAAVAALSVWAYFAPYRLSAERYLHRWDAFHYYVGGKYFRELGYDGLYECTLVTDALAGFEDRARASRVRDARTNELVPGWVVLDRAGACRERFAPERWRRFRSDVAWFRARFQAHHWARLRTDHGYNPPPTWSAFGGALLQLGPASERQLTALILLDPLLLGLALTLVARGFGWRAAAVSIIAFVTLYPADQRWTAGSILRLDWFVATLVGIALLRLGGPPEAGAPGGPGSARRLRWLVPVGAGAALAYAAAIRIFPATLSLALLGPFVRALRGGGASVLRRGWGGLLAGALALAAVALVGGAVSGGSLERWSDFVENSRTHLTTPLQNHLGLASLLAFDPALREVHTVGDAGDRYARWKRGRVETFAARRGLFAVLAVAYLALLVVATARQPAWAAAVLGAGAPLLLFELTGYYHVLLVAFALMTPARPAIGAGLLGLAALSQWAAQWLSFQDEIFFVTGLAAVAFVLGTTLAMLRRPAGERRPPAS